MLRQPSPISPLAGLLPLERWAERCHMLTALRRKDQELLDQVDGFPPLEYVQLLNTESRASQIPLGYSHSRPY